MSSPDDSNYLISAAEVSGEVVPADSGQWRVTIRSDEAVILREGGFFDEEKARQRMCDLIEPFWRDAFVTKTHAEGGYVGEDELGHLVRTLPGG